MGKQIEIRHVTKEQYEASKAGGKAPINGGAEIKAGYREMIKGYEDEANGARQQANELAKDASKEHELKQAGKSSGVDVGVGIGFSNDGTGWKFGFVDAGDSKLDKYKDAVKREEDAKDEIRSLKALSSMGVDAKDVKKLVDAGVSPSDIVDKIRSERNDGKSLEQAVNAVKKDCEVASISDDTKAKAAELAKNSFGEQSLEHKPDGATVASTSPNLATSTPTHSV